MGLFDPIYRDQTSSPHPQVSNTATANEFDSMAARVGSWASVEHNEDGTHNFNLSGNLVPIGSGNIWFTNTPPKFWLICDGSQVSRTTYQALFNVLGTTYGAGDGSTTFNLPDLRQRFPLGKAASGTGATIATSGGAIDHTHSLTGVSITGSTDSQGSHSHGGNTGDESSHTHSISITSAVPSSESALLYAVGGASVTLPNLGHTHAVSGTSAAGSAHHHSISSDGSHTHSITGTTGSGTSGATNPPYITINFIVLSGV